MMYQFKIQFILSAISAQHTDYDAVSNSVTEVSTNALTGLLDNFKIHRHNNSADMGLVTTKSKA
jgi:hypothetical protein